MVRKSFRSGKARSTGKGMLAPPRHFGRWRALTLAAVYVLFFVHILHWKLAGRTLAPLELNEVMYTLELGIVTAGFLFMAVVSLATLIFGRFFCSWGCHILALQDMAAWLLAKLRIRPKPIRSWALRWVPLGAMLYMFVWPQVSRLIEGRPAPALHLRTDAQGWASFLTTEFWRNLPSPGVTLATFFICGFVIVYMLGTRGFCTYGCPYGALFRVADRLAPGRIVARGDCSGCGACTAACQSHVVVHRELAAYGKVTDPACLKDLDCVAVCPQGNVAYGYTSPSLFSILSRPDIKRPRYDFSIGEEILMAAVFLATLFIFRGLYGLVPFLMTLALGGIFAIATVSFLRLFRRAHVRFNGIDLVRGRRLTRAGLAFACVFVLGMAGTVHSALIRYHEFRADRICDAPGQIETERLQAGIASMDFCSHWGLVQPPGSARRLGQLHSRLGQGLADAGDLAGAARHLITASGLVPDDAPTHYNLGAVLAALNRKGEAVQEYRRALQLAPDDVEVLNNLAFLLIEAGDVDAARLMLEKSVALKPDFAAPHFNLGRVYLTLGQLGEARRCFDAAVRLDRAYAPYTSALLEERAGMATTHQQAGTQP